jgi:hypothetical protein
VECGDAVWYIYVYMERYLYPEIEREKESLLIGWADFFGMFTGQIQAFVNSVGYLIFSISHYL